jgi:hypothetical protein
MAKGQSESGSPATRGRSDPDTLGSPHRYAVGVLGLMAKKTRPPTATRGKKQVSAPLIMKLAEMLEGLSAAGLLFVEADGEPDISDAERRFRAVRDACRQGVPDQPDFVEKLARDANREAQSASSTDSNSDVWIASAVSHLRRYLNGEYSPVIPDWVRPMADVFIDPFKQLRDDYKFHYHAANLAKTLRALATGQVDPDTLGGVPPSIDERPPPWDPFLPYREPSDPLIILGLLRCFRGRVTLLTDPADWPRWEEGTRQRRGFAFHRLTRMEQPWLDDAVQAGWSMDHACQVFLSLRSLANDLGVPPLEYPGQDALKAPLAELDARWDDIEPEVNQLARLVRARAAEQVRREPVALRGPGKRPLVLGRPVPRLYGSNYRIIEALVAAGEAGLRKDEIDAEAGVNSGVTYLRRLRDEHPDTWGRVIQMSGQNRVGYRIGLA